jgi:hypothetical protein
MDKSIQKLKSPILQNAAILERLQFLDTRHFLRIANIFVILNSMAE